MTRVNKDYLSVAKSHIVFVKFNIACVKIAYTLIKEIFAGMHILKAGYFAGIYFWNFATILTQDQDTKTYLDCFLFLCKYLLWVAIHSESASFKPTLKSGDTWEFACSFWAKKAISI